MFQLPRVRSDDGKKLLPGTLVDIGGGGELESEFFPGQLLGGGGGECDGEESGTTANVQVGFCIPGSGQPH